jgi:hypothetical protein
VKGRAQDAGHKAKKDKRQKTKDKRQKTKIPLQVPSLKVARGMFK